MQGSQFRNADGWVNNPLMLAIGSFMNSTISPVFGPQNIPYLSLVTQLLGSGNNALAAVPTASLPTPFIVKLAITGDQDYQLVAGVFVGAGYVAPNDQATSQKTWQQIS